eukprot:1977328-Rhodomonas_salina.1
MSGTDQHATMAVVYGTERCAVRRGGRIQWRWCVVVLSGVLQWRWQVVNGQRRPGSTLPALSTAYCVSVT